MRFAELSPEIKEMILGFMRLQDLVRWRRICKDTKNALQQYCGHLVTKLTNNRNELLSYSVRIVYYFS